MFYENGTNFILNYFRNEIRFKYIFKILLNYVKISTFSCFFLSPVIFA